MPFRDYKEESDDGRHNTDQADLKTRSTDMYSIDGQEQSRLTEEPEPTNLYKEMQKFQ